MDVKEMIIFSFSFWAVISLLIAQTFEIFLTILLIGTIVLYELSRHYIPPEVKSFLNPMIYIMLICFFIIVLKKAMEVLR